RTGAKTGGQALHPIPKLRPAFILRHTPLPIMAGPEAPRRIKADASLRSIPIIAVTSYALSGEEKKARAAGCDDYVPKPFSPRQLLAKIGNTWLRFGIVLLQCICPLLAQSGHDAGAVQCPLLTQSGHGRRPAKGFGGRSAQAQIIPRATLGSGRICRFQPYA